ncbi:hypothetical protein NOGI109294_24105 [Nocardiopsis gilva]
MDSETNCSARRRSRARMPRPLSSIVTVTPVFSSSTYTWTSVSWAEKVVALSINSATACMTPSAA